MNSNKKSEIGAGEGGGRWSGEKETQTELSTATVWS